MTEFVKQQGVIWFRIILTIVMVGAVKTVWDMKTTMLDMSHSTKSIARDVSIIAKRMDTMEQNIEKIKEDVHNNKTKLAVHEVKINKLED